ncbi:MAG TPA: LysR family transcriptional regulator [Solirubrobacteraceae bacterium]|jgi:DNA-binding transcriptional LysR family regulator|nr:LysR family transcriptional regulator [Solirubrobacteraceae bacterium]
MLNVARLATFVEVARQGSISAAALELTYTQSAVSQQIAALEGEAGVALLERHARGVRLTAAGQALLAAAEGVLARLEAAEAELAAIGGLRGGLLRAASFPTAGATLMPLAIATFRARHPDVEITLAEGEPEQIAPRLAAGELDLALLFEFDDGAQHGESLQRVELLHDPMYLALPGGHRLAHRRRLRLEDLSGEAWIQTSSDSACARYVVRSCMATGFTPNVSFESDDYQTIQGLVAAGVGVALIPELALSSVRQDIATRRLDPQPPGRQVVAASPKGAATPSATAMLAILQEIAARYTPIGPAASS